MTNIPELYELLDERDIARRAPDSEANRAHLRVLDFQIKIRRGTTGNIPKMEPWQHQMLKLAIA